MHPAVIKVVPCSNYILSLDFENGEKGKLDLKPVLNFGVFQKLKDPKEFNQVRVSFDTIEWSCGVDLDPEYIYKNSIKSTIT